MTQQQAGRTTSINRTSLWFGLLGGGVAWLFHFLSAYLVAEFGCMTRLSQMMFLGLTAVAWLIIGLSILWTAVAAAATWVSWQSAQGTTALEMESDGNTSATGPHIARVGFYTSALFTLIIIVESVPIFFYLRDC